jgi:hypothetical protein
VQKLANVSEVLDSPLATLFEGVIGFWQLSDKLVAGVSKYWEPSDKLLKGYWHCFEIANFSRGLPTPSDHLSNGY